MKSIAGKVGAWFKQAHLTLKNMEKAMDYHFEDYAIDRLKALEQRIAALEGTPGKRSAKD